jgi:hypothetical protein
LVSDLLEPTPSLYFSRGQCANCKCDLDRVVKKTVLDSPPQLLVFEILFCIGRNAKAKPAQPKDMGIEPTLELEFSQTMATYRLKGFVTFEKNHYENYFVVDGLEDFFLFYSNFNCANPALVKRESKYKIAVACYGLREEDVNDDDEVLEFDEVTEVLRNKCTQEIIRALNTLTPSKRMTKTKQETMRNFNQLKIMLQKQNKKTKYFLPLIEQFLFPDSNTRDFILESGEGEKDVGDNYKENILDDQG